MWAAIAAVLFAVAIFMGTASGGVRPTPPEWRSLAGLANRACYDRHGVRQLFAGGTNYTDSEVDVVCRDGWAVNIYVDVYNGSWAHNQP